MAANVLRRAHTTVWTLLAVTAGLSVSGIASPPRGDFPLGQNANAMVCEAQRNDDTDPSTREVHHARAWGVFCRGWGSDPVGHLYLFRDDDPGAGTRRGSSWYTNVHLRAQNCLAPATIAIGSLDRVQRSECSHGKGRSAYLVYEARIGDAEIAADGPAGIADLLETGLKVVADVAPPPASATDRQALGSYTATAVGNTSDFAESLAARDENLRALEERASLENDAWLFSAAERDFEALTLKPNLPPRDKARFELNRALAVSNQGRYAEADALFRRAHTDVSPLGLPELNALELNYLALHAANQRDFPAVVRNAQDAISIRRNIGGASDSARGVTVASTSAGIEIGAGASMALNPSDADRGFRSMLLSPEDELRIADAQAFYVLACAQFELGLAQSSPALIDASRGSLVKAQALLDEGNHKRTLPWLRAQILGQKARLETHDGALGAALEDATRAVSIFDSQRALEATPSEGGLHLLLGDLHRRIAAKDDPGAREESYRKSLDEYETGIRLFMDSRGALGPSGDGLAPYLDLLVGRMNGDAAAVQTAQERYFFALQAMIAPGTAQTVAQLAARADRGSDVHASNTARLLQDAVRQATVLQNAIELRQASQDYPADQQAADSAQLATARQLVRDYRDDLTKDNPKYAELLENVVTLTELQAALKEHEIYYRCVLLAHGGYGIAITKSSVDVFRIALNRGEAQTLVKDIRKSFDNPRIVGLFNVPAAHALYQKLFGSVESRLMPDAKGQVRHLIYDPDTQLISVPAGVLVTDQASVDRFDSVYTAARRKQADVRTLYDDVSWLATKADISLEVSATAFVQMRRLGEASNLHRQPDRRKFVGLGAPAFTAAAANDKRLFGSVAPSDGTTPAVGGATACENFRSHMVRDLTRPLPNMDRMISDIGSKLGAQDSDYVLGASFTDTDVTNPALHDLAQYDIVFFGTHGLLPDARQCLKEPALVTSLGGADSDGLLDASEILGLHLNAEIVVLAGCSTGGTGSGSALRTGLEDSAAALGGLARDFIYAGGYGLVVSQWNLDEGPTLELMRAMFTAPPDTDHAEALRLAEMHVMGMTDGAAGVRKFAHPYYWAGFSFVGDGARTMNGSR